MSEFDPDLYVEGLERELIDCKRYVVKLEEANKSMLTLIHLNDQKAALMEASPEFAEAMKKIETAS